MNVNGAGSMEQMQMRKMDASTLSAEDYTRALLDILTQSDTEKAETDYFSVYA